MMPHGERLAELHRKAQRVATAYYLRYGRISAEVKEVLAATESLEGLRKYDPDQLRVPAGRPGGGRWTDGGDWFDPAHPPGYVDFLAPDDKPLEQVYIVEAMALLAVWEAVAAARIVAGLAAPVLVRVASTRRINQAAKAIEEYLGGKPDKVFRNPAEDLVIMRGDKKIRFDINNHSHHDEPHYHIEKGVHNGRRTDWVDADSSQHGYPFMEGK